MPLSLAALMCLESSPLLRYEHLFDDNKAKPKKRKRRVWLESALRQRRQIQFAVTYRKLRENPSEFFNHLSVSAAIFDYVLEHVRDGLTNSIPDFIPPEEKLYMVLKYLKGLVPMKTLAEHFGLNTEETQRVLENTLIIIWNKLQPIHLQPPTHTDTIDLAREYHQKWNFPNCVGAIGGKCIRIENMDPDKKSKVRILNIVVDANFRIITVFVDSRRRTDEVLVKNMTYVNGVQCLPGTDTMLPLVVIGNDAYQLKTNLMAPYSKRAEKLSTENQNFNKVLRSARIPVDAVFEILTEKWQVCNSPFTMRLEETRLVLKVCCLLYNIIKDREGGKDPHFVSFGRVDKGCIYLSLMTNATKQANKSPSNTALCIRDQFRDYIQNHSK